VPVLSRHSPPAGAGAAGLAPDRPDLQATRQARPGSLLIVLAGGDPSGASWTAVAAPPSGEPHGTYRDGSDADADQDPRR
jgi:hypothetical protein